MGQIAMIVLSSWRFVPFSFQLSLSTCLIYGAGGSRNHVQTPANTFVYNHR